jgi:hypothetical protein
MTISREGIRTSLILIPYSKSKSSFTHFKLMILPMRLNCNHTQSCKQGSQSGFLQLLLGPLNHLPGPFSIPQKSSKTSQKSPPMLTFVHYCTNSLLFGEQLVPLYLPLISGYIINLNDSH